MAKKDKLVKSKSIYTIKKEHAKSTNGIIYENDHITIIPNDGIYDDGMALFSESNFKYIIDSNKSSKKRHNRGEYIKPENSDEETWTLGTISGCTGESEETKIVLKPNYSSLKDFAYYGSAVELIKATVNDIVLNYPGGLYYYGSKAPVIYVGDETYYLISNEFNLDCWTGGGLISSDDIKNPMKILAASYMNYTLADGKTECSSPIFTPITACPDSIIGTVNFGAGDFSVYMNGDGKKFLVSETAGKEGDVIIKPKQEFIDEFWNKLDDFGKVLLNRDTTPIYKAVFETPYSDETGFYYQNKTYVWPTISGTTVPDITTGAFQGYLESLISLASFHDEYDSDNIWRMMTHDSIKNMDWTFTSKKGDNEEDLSDFDTNGIGAMIRIYGRQFDDIKRYADNIKNTNTISYDEKGNLPDYFLTDTVENNGWVAQHTAPFGVETTDTLKTHNSGKTISYVNSTFQRRLSLNSNYIRSMKGTRRGIESILGLFGYSAVSSTTSTVGEYNISEYVAVTTSGLSYVDGYTLRAYGDNQYEIEGSPHLMAGLPVALVKPMDSKNDDYLVPWYYRKNRSADFYFQSYGGWGKRASKKINLPITSATTLSGDTIPIYGETQPYMRFAKNINEMLSQSQNELYENIICYVTDISDIEQNYLFDTGDETTDFSHYFALKNVMLSTHCGFISNDLYNCYGWKNITEEEILNLSSTDAKRVVYLESLIANYNGNNPHIGNGKYDDGSKYLEYFTHIFKESFEQGFFEEWKEDEPEIYASASTFGFTVCEREDNNKCSYFKDYTVDVDREIILGASEEEEEKEGEKEETNDDNETVSSLTEFGVADTSIKWNSSVYTDIEFPDTPSNVEGIADESQANGIINLKKLVINFGVGNNENEYLKNYIQTVVLKYLEEMIPSTAILEYRFNGESVIQAVEATLGGGSYKFVRTAHAAIDNEDDTITVWREYPTPINEM